VKLSVTVEQEKWPTWLQPRAFSTKPRHGHAVATFECTHSSPPCPTLSTHTEPQRHCRIWSLTMHMYHWLVKGLF